MKRDEVIKFREKYTEDDVALATDLVAELVIHKENDIIYYHPYYLNRAIKIALACYFVEGLEIDLENDIVFDVIEADKELKELLDEVLYADVSYQIREYAKDIIDFKKDLYINDISDLKERLFKSIEQEQKLNELSYKIVELQTKYLTQEIDNNEKTSEIMEKFTPDEIAEMNKKLLSGDYDTQKITDMVVSKYFQSATHEEKLNELIDEKNKKIIELQKDVVK